jgi:hypothetical protein
MENEKWTIVYPIIFGVLIVAFGLVIVRKYIG